MKSTTPKLNEKKRKQEQVRRASIELAQQQEQDLRERERSH